MRRTPTRQEFSQAGDVLNTVAALRLPGTVPLIRARKNVWMQWGVVFHANVRLLKPLGFKDYNALQVAFKAVLSDSGTINEESSILNLALTSVEAHDSEGNFTAAATNVGPEVERVMQAFADSANPCPEERSSLRFLCTITACRT